MSPPSYDVSTLSRALVTMSSNTAASGQHTMTPALNLSGGNTSGAKAGAGRSKSCSRRRCWVEGTGGWLWLFSRSDGDDQVYMGEWSMFIVHSQ